MKKYRITESQYKTILNEIDLNRRRFRASIYVDVIVPKTDDLERDREKAEEIVEQERNKIDLNNFLGGLAEWPKGLHRDPEELKRL